MQQVTGSKYCVCDRDTSRWSLWCGQASHSGWLAEWQGIWRKGCLGESGVGKLTGLQGPGTGSGRALVTELKAAATGHVCGPRSGRESQRSQARRPAPGLGLAVLSWEVMHAVPPFLFHNRSLTHVSADSSRAAVVCGGYSWELA